MNTTATPLLNFPKLDSATNAWNDGLQIPLLRRGIYEPDTCRNSTAIEGSRIVSILDKFNALTDSISEGLPREIELRQKQYEYYRNPTAELS